jgi:hypothetical protein
MGAWGVWPMRKEQISRQLRVMSHAQNCTSVSGLALAEPVARKPPGRMSSRF